MTGNLSCVDAGSGSAVVLLHAFPCTRQMWDAQTPYLAAAGRRVIAPDLPGFGESPLSEEEPSMAALARPVLDLLDRLDIEQAVFAGLSMGGYVAMEILRMDPERVAGLVLLDTKSEADAQTARANRLRIAERADSSQDCGFLAADMIPALLGDTIRAARPEVTETVSRWIRGTDPAAVAWAQRAMAGRPDSRADLARFTGPALVIVGDEDRTSPLQEARTMAGALGNCEVVVIERSGHLSAVEQPDAVNRALGRFLGL